MINLRRIADIELNIGPLRLDAKKLLIIGGAIVLIVGGTSYKVITSYQQAKIAEEQAKQEEMEALTITGPKALSLDELEDGNYYIKDGDTFYALPDPLITSEVESDTLIPEEANDLRLAQLTTAQSVGMPTLYNDTQLIYYNSSNTPLIEDAETGEQMAMPKTYWVERYKDQGYTLGISRLSPDESGKIKLNTSNTSSVFADSSAGQNIDTTEGASYIISSIAGKELTSDSLSPSGTITGLVKDQSYKVDIYSGTSYVGGDYIADTHALTSYELYEVTDYTLSTGYVTINIPTTYQNGYYYINGAGMFKYVNGSKTSGDADVDYNIPYYISDEEGNILENTFVSKVPVPQQEEVSGTDDKEEAKDAWKFNISIDNQQAELNVVVVYTEAAKNYFDSISTPTAVLVSPTGEETDLINEGGEIMNVSIKDPMLGTWTLKLYGMENKTFDVNTSFTGNTANMIVKNTNNDATMNIYLDKDIKDGSFIFDWTDDNHAGMFDITTADGDKIVSSTDEDATTESTYGHSKIKVGDLEKGEYKIVVKGESLGSVYFKYEDGSEDISDESGEVSSDDYVEDTSAEASSEDTSEEALSEDTSENTTSDNATELSSEEN